MSEWREVTLGDVLTIKHGFAFKGEYFRADGSEVLLTPKNFLADGGLDLTPSRLKRYEGPVDPDYMLQAGAIVMAMTDLKQEAPILGSTGVIPASGRYLHNQRIGLVEPSAPSRLDRSFIPWLLNSPAVRTGIRASASGATVRHTAPNRIYALRTHIPTALTQRRIAAVLSAFDEQIEIDERRIELLEQQAHSLYRDLARTSGNDWVAAPLFDLAEVTFGYPFKADRFSPDGLSPVIRIRDIPTGIASIRTDEPADAKYMVDDGDVLIGMDGTFHMRQWSAGEAWLNQRVARLRPRGELSARHLMLSISRQIKDLNHAIVGTTVAHLGKRHLEEIKISLPPRDELLGATIQLDSFANAQIALEKRNRQLAATRDLLLPRLVTGRLDISEVDLGVLTPAEVE